MKSTAFTEDDYSLAYPPGIEHHFWTKTRIHILTGLIRKHNLASSKMLEIGCGKGIILRALRNRGFDCYGADLANVEAEEDIRRFTFLNQDAMKLDPSFRESVETILLLDVLEHIEHTTPFLEEMARAFVNVKAFFIMVPARKEFWSNYDEYYGHFRRYELPLTKELGRTIGFDVAVNSYFFHFLYFVAWVLFKLSNKREIRGFAPGRWMIPVHYFVSLCFYLEYLLLPRMIPGSSIVTVLTKR